MLDGIWVINPMTYHEYLNSSKSRVQRLSERQARSRVVCPRSESVFQRQVSATSSSHYYMKRTDVRRIQRCSLFVGYTFKILQFEKNGSPQCVHRTRLVPFPSTLPPLPSLCASDLGLRYSIASSKTSLIITTPLPPPQRPS